MKVSIIIPTFNRGEVLKKTIVNLLKSKRNETSWEIVVVDDGSNAINHKIVASVKNLNKRINVVYKDNGGPASARNLAIKKASGEILIFINDDTLVEDYFIDKHVKFHLQNKEITKSVLGRFLTPRFKTQSPAMKWLVDKSGLNFVYREDVIKNGVVPWSFFWTCNLSLKKQFMKLNKLEFDESFPTAAWEDVEFGYRARFFGLELTLDNDIKAYHNHNFTFDEVINRFYSHGRGLYYYKKKVPHRHWTSLTNEYIRLPLRIILIEPIMSRLEDWLRHKDVLPNILMQILVVYKKIKGFMDEEKLIKYDKIKNESCTNISRD